jgi:hypothetical protein
MPKEGQRPLLLEGMLEHGFMDLDGFHGRIGNQKTDSASPE